MKQFTGKQYLAIDIANSMGLDKVLAKINHYHETTGDDFWAPSSLLVSLAEQGKRFK
jgi:3-hydroxyacyl-CoA dehydrogenase